MNETGWIVFEGVSKRYRPGTLGSLRSIVADLSTRPRQREQAGARYIWALRDVSFRVAPGECLGLIGPNGAGKTTALKLVSHISVPTEGRVAVTGRTSSLIELGAGFHPELTGRENIYLNGAILGLNRRELEQRLEAIVAFSGLERFIDMPVKRYSSGMYVRLGFAIAAHVEPQVLLVDEVLAVGDAQFRHLCIERMAQLREQGTTMLFVSHNMHLVREVCDRAILLAEGTVRAEGEPDSVIAAYEHYLYSQPPPPEDEETRVRLAVDDGAAVSLGRICFTAPNGSEATMLDGSQAAWLRIPYRSAGRLHVGRIDVRILRQDGVECSVVCSDITALPDHRLREIDGEGLVELEYAPLQLAPGDYRAVVRFTDASDSDVIASGQSAWFKVSPWGVGGPVGVYVPTVHWHLDAPGDGRGSA